MSRADSATDKLRLGPWTADAPPTCSWGRNQSHSKRPPTPPLFFLASTRAFFKSQWLSWSHGSIMYTPPPQHTQTSVPMHLSLQMLRTRATRVMSLISETQCCPCLVQQPLTVSLVIHDHETGPCNTIGFICDPVWGNDMHAICMRSQIKLLCIYTDT